MRLWIITISEIRSNGRNNYCRLNFTERCFDHLSPKGLCRVCALCLLSVHERLKKLKRESVWRRFVAFPVAENSPQTNTGMFQPVLPRLSQGSDVLRTIPLLDRNIADKSSSLTLKGSFSRLFSHENFCDSIFPHRLELCLRDTAAGEGKAQPIFAQVISRCRSWYSISVYKLWTEQNSDRRVACTRRFSIFFNFFYHESPRWASIVELEWCLLKFNERFYIVKSISVRLNEGIYSTQ